MAVKARQAEVVWQALGDAILEKKTDSLLECFLDDDSTRMLVVLRSDVSYDFALKQGKFRLPKILRNGSSPIMHAAFLGAIKCVRTLIDLSSNPMAKDRRSLTPAHFACAGGIFDICRELDNLGVNFALLSRSGSPAKLACEFGRDELVFWLWTRGALLATPQVGWRAKRGGDPDVLCAAALNGHSTVLRILVESVGIRFNVKLSESGESAVSCACRNGHDEVLEVLFELGACVNDTALPAAIRSGSFKCVERLLERKVKVNSSVVELAAACGHVDVLRRLLRVCSEFGCSWTIAWLDGFGDGQRMLEAAGASAWTASGVKLLMGRPGKAAELASVVAPPEAMIGAAEWQSAEFQGVVARLMRDGVVPVPLLRAVFERNWTVDSCPFATCSAAEFAPVVIPPGVSMIGDFALYGCSGLTRVVIPSTVTTIGKYAFWGCSGLTEVIFPPSLTAIGYAAFYDCSGLTRVEIPAGVTTIADWTFGKCSGMTQVVIPSSVTTIGDYAFQYCARLTHVELPSSVGTIGDAAFLGCSHLAQVVIPSNVAVIEGSAFSGVTRIERLILVGSPLSPAVVESLDHRLRSTATVVGAALAGQRFGRFTIVDA
jgi:ankyrin repeat protein